MSLSDEQLVGRYLLEKDEIALEELVKRYLPLIYGFVRNYIGNEDIASDITQEVFVKAWKNLKQFDRSKSFKTWIFTIAKRTAIDILKKRNAIPFSAINQDGGGDFSESLADTTRSIPEQLSLKETGHELVLAFAKLPVGYDTVIKLRINDGLKFQEIAKFLREPLNTVKSRYRRGISLLKNIILHQK